MNTTDKNQSDTADSISSIEARLKDKYVLFTKEEWAAYKRMTLVVLIAFGLSGFSAAWLAAKAEIAKFSKDQTFVDLQKLKEQAESDAKFISGCANTWRGDEYAKHLKGMAIGLEAVYNFEPKGSSKPSDDNLLGARYRDQVVPARDFFTNSVHGQR